MLGLCGSFTAQAQAPATPVSVHARPKVIFLDVNETLLDLGPLKKSVGEALGGREDLLALWFSTMLHHSLVDTTTGRYHDFGAIGVAALQMVAESNGITLSKEQAQGAILPAFGKLPPHPDVITGLQALKKQGFTLVSFTNSTDAGVKKQLENAGLTELIDRRVSIEPLKIYKPDLRAYQYALQQLGIEAKDSLLVAAHGWDIAGAEAAGWQTAFVARPAKSLYPLADAPDYIVKDLNDLAEKLAAVK
jgi:2-haloacid dehalogenase